MVPAADSARRRRGRGGRTGSGLGWAWVALGGLALGAVLLSPGVFGIDDPVDLRHQRAILSDFGLFTGGEYPADMHYYAPLWPLALGLTTDVLLGFLDDPHYARHVATFALWPLMLYGTARLLARAGVARPTAWLCAAGLFAIVRLGGHALVNPKDFPAAAAYLLVTLGLWGPLDRIQRDEEAWHLGPLAAAGALAALPYLVRTPLLIHLGLVGSVLGLIALRPSRRSGAQRLALVLVPLLTFAAVCLAVFPKLWDEGLVRGIWHSVAIMGEKSRGEHFTGVFGWRFSSLRVPWWYAAAWLPVIGHPVLLVLGVAGGVAGGGVALARLRGGGWRSERLTLAGWLLLVTVAGWATVAAVRPNLYDEERHVLFLYPPLCVWLLLQLDRLREKTRLALAALLVLAATTSYIRWGRYAYVYRSPVVAPFSARGHLGDYWGTCVAAAITELPRAAPGAGEAAVRGWALAPAAIQYRRRHQSLVYRDPEFPELRFLPAGERPTAPVIFFERGDGPYWAPDVVGDVAAGAARLLWADHLPTGELACGIARYDAGEAATGSPDG